MNENKVALSQAEIDKLLGKQIDYDEKKSASSDSVKKRTPVEKIATEKQLEDLKVRILKVIEEFKDAIKESFDENGNRKIVVTNVELINAQDFENELVYPNFIYKVETKSGCVFVKLDNNLFAALGNISSDKTIKPNRFQAVVLQEEIMPLLIQPLFANLSDENDSVNITLVEDGKLKECEEIKANKTGVLIPINWNENFKSFGVEKIFLCGDMYKNI